MDTAEGNILIHDWMGNKRMKPPFAHEWIGQEKVSDLKYHTSWDWLMPVWAKAGKIMSEMKYALQHDKLVTAYRITKTVLDGFQKVEIKESWEGIIEAIQFIEAHNSETADAVSDTTGSDTNSNAGNQT